MTPDAITTHFALETYVKAEQYARNQLYKALVPYTLRNDLLALSRNETQEGHLLELDPRHLLDLVST